MSVAEKVGLKLFLRGGHMYFELYKSGNEWRWRLRAANHEIIASGEGYVSRQGAEHAVYLLRQTNMDTPFYDRTGG